MLQLRRIRPRITTSSGVRPPSGVFLAPRFRTHDLELQPPKSGVQSFPTSSFGQLERVIKPHLRWTLPPTSISLLINGIYQINFRSLIFFVHFIYSFHGGWAGDGKCRVHALVWLDSTPGGSGGAATVTRTDPSSDASLTNPHLLSQFHSEGAYDGKSYILYSENYSNFRC